MYVMVYKLCNMCNNLYSVNKVNTKSEMLWIFISP